VFDVSVSFVGNRAILSAKSRWRHRRNAHPAYERSTANHWWEKFLPNAHSTFAHRPLADANRLNDDSLVTVRRSLRAATWDKHTAIDRTMSGFDLTKPDEYRDFLNIHRSALRHLEADWREEDRADFLALTLCLEDDLNIPGSPLPPLRMLPRTPLNIGNKLGAAYVIRGSRLGSAILRRRVPPQFPAAYLNYVPTLSWVQFLQELEQSAMHSPLGASVDVIGGALLAFEVFANLSAQGFAGTS
jgi:heme oxygenase